ncbi:hypothetical protein [Nocardiopsis aegyptia]|uniref:Uncharacterized protein n=1 Tax=Nocardiopsis aegyptia TaxID=220378 RepID=A0A7Z0J8U4_9ACTN|nr:hypothetical protein [Nocardiopsis aegyptia]NYJ33453.1 hypothetical protein [Nocardiopsis aegyptia]
MMRMMATRTTEGVAMTGPEHFKQGEKLLAKAEGREPNMPVPLVQRAQAHFMAAQVVATIRTAYASMPDDENALQLQDEWGM